MSDNLVAGGSVVKIYYSTVSDCKSKVVVASTVFGTCTSVFGQYNVIFAFQDFGKLTTPLSQTVFGTPILDSAGLINSIYYQLINVKTTGTSSGGTSYIINSCIQGNGRVKHSMMIDEIYLH